MLDTVFRRMMKFVKKKAGPTTSGGGGTSQTTAVDISRPTNLIVSKHKLVPAGDGNFILIMEGDKCIGVLDKRDLDVMAPKIQAPPPPFGGSSSSTPSPQYLTPSSSTRDQQQQSLTSSSSSTKQQQQATEPPVLPSPGGIGPANYVTGAHSQTLPAGGIATAKAQLFLRRSHEDQTNGYGSATSVEQLFSPPIPNTHAAPHHSRHRSDSAFPAQASTKSGRYDTIPISSASAHVEIHLGAEAPPPPPPNRPPPAPLSMSPCQTAIVEPVFNLNLDYTEVQTVSVEDPALAEMSMEDMRRYAEDLDAFLEEQVQQKYSQNKAELEQWVGHIAEKVAKTETMNTIRGQWGSRKKRPSLTELIKPSSPAPSQAPSDPEPHYVYEKLYNASSVPTSPPLKKQSTQESDGDIEDVRF